MGKPLIGDSISNAGRLLPPSSQ